MCSYVKFSSIVSNNDEHIMLSWWDKAFIDTVNQTCHCINGGYLNDVIGLFQRHFSKRQLPKSNLWEVATWKVATWEVATWEVATWEAASGKCFLGNYLIPLKIL